MPPARTLLLATAQPRAHLLAACRFYDKAHKLDALDFFKRFAVHPDALPDTVFASIGRTVWRDIGPTALAFRTVVKVGAALRRAGARGALGR